MEKVKIDTHTKKRLLELYETRKVSLEGNILKLIDSDDDAEFDKYVKESIERDKERSRKRLDVTRQVQTQNSELTKLNKENSRVNRQLTKALEEAEISKNEAEISRDQAEKSRDLAESARIEAENTRIEAENAKTEAENAKSAAVNDLELLQKKKQFELIGLVVRASLIVILGVGLVTTIMYGIALYTGVDTTVLGSTWSNIIGIMLTNAFSIVGTIMGVKYATKNSED